MADVNQIGTKALASAPGPISRLLSSIKPVFSTYSGASKGIGPQPSADSPIAGVPSGSPNQILVTDPARFNKSPGQVALHEAIHSIQNNLTPEQQKAIPPDTGNPLVAIDPKYLAAQRKAGKTILQLPKEQQAYLGQYYQSKKEAFENGSISKKEMDHIEDTYGPWIKDFNKAQLSTIIPTDPNSTGNTIVTTPRAPLPPVDLQQSTVQFDSSSTVPATSDSGDRNRFEQQTADMGSLIDKKRLVPANIDVSRNAPTKVKADKDANKPVDWMQPHHSYAADAGAEKPANFRPSHEHSQQFKNNDEDSQHDPYETSQAKSLREQLLKNRIADVENPLNKNPFNFTHPLDRQAATYAKAQRIVKNPHFAALPDDQKTHILDNYYDKYIVPIYKQSKIEPPNKDIWVRTIQNKNSKFEVGDFYHYSEAVNKDAFSDFQSGVAHAAFSERAMLGHVSHSILMAGVAVDRKILGLANFFPGSSLHSWAQSEADYDAKIAAPALKLSQDTIDHATFWLDTHPTRSFTEKAGSFVGEGIVQLPLYETIAAPLGLLGKAVSSAGEIGKAANFTRRLATSKAGQFAGRRLAEASSAYVGDIFSETPEGQRSTDMALFMGLGVGSEALSALVKPISRTVMKKVVATNVAIGGKVLHETVADQAAFELEHNIVGTDAAGQPIVHDPNVHGPEDFHNQMAAAQQADPIKHSMITAEKISQNAMARQMYSKPLNQLSQLQRRNVRVELARMTSEATVEIPIHVPEVAQHEVQTQLTEDVKVNPELAQTFEGLEKKYGAKIVDSVVQTEQDSIAVEHGIKSSQGATKRVGRNTDILAEKNAELGTPGTPKTPAKEIKKEDQYKLALKKARASYSALDPKSVENYEKALKDYELSRPAGMKQFLKEQMGQSKTPGDLKDVDELERMFNVKESLPKSYVSFKSQTLAHFTNPFNSAAAKSNQSLAKFLDGMDDADFVQEISDQMGNQLKFEKPHDMLLWGLHHSDGIPTPIVSKIKKVLHDNDPNGTIQSWKDEGRRLSAHIDMLAMSGRLDTEGNVFRSTITTSFTGRTKWQREAEIEAAKSELENYKTTMAPYAKNFKEEYESGLKNLAKLQTLRGKSKTDEDFFAAHDKVKKLLESAEGRK